MARYAELQKGSKSRSINDAGWSSLVARRAHNPKVVSSNLTPATMGAYEENPLSALLIYGYELSRNTFQPQLAAANSCSSGVRDHPGGHPPFRSYQHS